MSHVAVTLAAVSVVVGALAGEHLGPSPGGWCLAGAGAALAGALRAGVRRRALAGGLVALGLVAAALMQRALDGLDGPLAGLVAREATVVATVRLQEDPRRWRWNTRVLGAAVLRRDGCAGPPPVPGCRPVSGTVAVVAGGATAGRLRVLAAGETVVVSGWLRPLAGPERRLRWRHAAAVLVADDVLAAGGPVSPLQRLAGGLRNLVLSGTRGLPDIPAALTAGLLVGDDRDLTARVAADFRAAGLSHLLAVSGANVALVLAVAGPGLRRLGLAGRFVGGVGVVVVFAAMARFEPSVLRASAMAGIALLAAYTGRPAASGRVLALAVAGLVLADPFLVHSLGFRLSVAASAGILALAGPFASRLPGPGPVRHGLAVTAAAQLGVAPVALPAFGSLPLVALPANLLAAPAAAGLTLWGFGSGLAGGLLEPLVPVLPGALAVPTGVLASYLAAVASLAARCPVPVGPGVAAGVAGLTGLVLAGARLQRRGGPWPAGARHRSRCRRPAPPGP